MARRKPTSHDHAQLNLRFLWGAPDAKPETINDEPVRQDGAAALGEVAAVALPADRGPEQLLREPGRGDSGTSGGAEHAPGGQRPAGRDLHAEARATEHGATRRRVTSPPGDGATPARAEYREPQRDLEELGKAGDGNPAIAQAARGAVAPDAQSEKRPPVSGAPPTGEVARVRANIAALKTLRNLQASGATASSTERSQLGQWSGWGAVPAVFDKNSAAHERFAWARAELSALLSPEERAAAERSTLNAHYTDPHYAQAMWQAARELGFSEGAVLEPGCGSGNFLALAPPKARCVGVELEPLTAAIAQARFPEAQVHSESFADSRLPEAGFDLVIGNVPFGDLALHDRRHNAAGHRIHNHFLIKSLHLTRPGGLLVAITSRYTMDAANPAARREMSELADLIGAVRLPSGAHRNTAGTNVVTDVLVLRRREREREPSGHAFERSRVCDGLGDDRLRINEYFVQHPEHVLGALQVGQGDRGRPELVVDGERDAGVGLQAALAEIARAARAAGLVLSDRREPPGPRTVALRSADARRPDGYLDRTPNGGFTRLVDGAAAPYQVPATQARELKALLELRDIGVQLLEAEAATNDDTLEIESTRRRLNQTYDAYRSAFGPLNRFSERRTGRLDPDTGEEKRARVRPGQGGFLADPYANVVYALEHFDDATQSATKAAIFRERVVARAAPPRGADTPADALAIALDQFGEARLGEISRLLGVDDEEARLQLGSLVFDEPGSSRLVPAAEYLSGNVRVKLDAAKAAALVERRFESNVDALAAVVPRPLRPDEIHARLGSAWIGREHVQAFLQETLEDPTVVVEHPGGTLWEVRSKNAKSVLATSTWGTERCSAIDLAQALLEQRPLRIYDVDEREGTRTFNETATIAVAEKANELSARFSEWVWENPERATSLAATYNKRFNAIVPRSYDDAKLSLPGLAVTFQPRPHQIAAVARIIHEPAVGLFHEVGAGKTAEMVMGAMELRRLGLVNKPGVVVPNHMLEQFTREWLQLYPQAKLLAASNEDLERDRRKLFVAKCATGDWDAVIIARGAFERIPMSIEVQRDYLRHEVSAIEDMVLQARTDGASVSLKRLQRMKVQAEERLKKKLDGAKDVGINFEQVGLDYLFVDEAHAYKNLRTTSNIPGMSVDGSQRASDLHMKLEHLRSKGLRVGTLATATPIANSMGEAYTMQRYLRPDLLEAAGIMHFDQWGGTFGETTTSIEVTPDGSGMRMQSRFAKFRNVPELLLMWRVSADIKTAEDLELPVPALAERPLDGKRAAEVVLVPPSDELSDFIKELAYRADRVRGRRVPPSEDNLLRISSDGRAAGLDLRLLGASTSEPQKVEIAAARIAAIYDQHRNVRYHDMHGVQHPTPGALQLVFSDLGTPKAPEWSVYEELRAQLVQRGVPRGAVRFMHEARNDREKAELFAACRDGRVAVLIGSTERMGVGTNVQRRAVALHHLDCPWRPADLAQRDGRILRQGNENAEVRIIRYVTEGSFDAYLWQTVSRKAQFIGQVMRGRLDVREIDDIGDSALSYNEVKALATGNPLLLEHAQAQAEVSRLERLQRAHARSQQTLGWTVHAHRRRIEQLDARVAQFDSALLHAATTLDRPFSLTLRGRTYDKRSNANAALRFIAAEYLAGAARASQGDDSVGSYRGFTLTAISSWDKESVLLALRDVPDSDITVRGTELEAASLLTRLDNRLSNLEGGRAAAIHDRKQLEREIGRAQNERGAPFRQADLLATERERLVRLEEHLAALTRPVAIEAQPDAASASNGTPVPSKADVAIGVDDEQGRLLAGDALKQRWAALLTLETDKVRERAVVLQAKLNRLAGALQEALAAHREAEPSRPGALARMLGSDDEYVADHARWSKTLQTLEQRAARVVERSEHVQKYSASPVRGYSSPSSKAASSRLRRREPELSNELASFLDWRGSAARKNHERHAERARDKTDRGLSR
jgi:N12 class adenine-specific DNA methylase/SAM-dependent methyltransferase